MKQIIVMLSMVLLGILISGMVAQFGTSAQDLTTSVNDEVLTLSDTLVE
jgi:hypothetical protein